MKKTKNTKTYRNHLLSPNEADILKKIEKKIKFGFDSDSGTVTDFFFHEGDSNSVSHEISQLESLKSISFDHKPVSNIPEWFTECKSLVNLSFSFQNFDNLSPISEIRGLKSLFLTRCNLSELPDSFSQLSKLSTLGLSFNSFSRIPEVIGSFTLLEKILY